MRYRAAMLLLLLLLQSIAAETPAPVPEPASPTPVTVGMFVTRIDDLDMVANAFDTTFWMWCKTSAPEFTIEGDVELPGGRSTEFSNLTQQEADGLRSQAVKCKASIAKDWNLANYPFDRQQLTIRIEATERTVDQIAFVPDLANTKVLPDIALEGYHARGITATTGATTYDSDFGELVASGDVRTYPWVDFHVDLVHDGMKVFVKLFIATYAAFVVALLTVLLKPEDIDAKLALVLTSFFAVIGNQYILDSTVHSSGGFNLIDKIQASTFAFAVLASALCVVAARFAEHPRRDHYIISERILMAGFSLGYIVFNVVIVRSAMG
jgi:hypothetical protein